MKNTSILALVTAAIVASSSLALAESAKPNANANAKAGMSTDATTTGSVSADVKTNFGTVISGLQAGKGADLSAFNKDTSQIQCVNVSSLTGDASADAPALDNALTKNESAVTGLRGDITANADLLAKIKNTCSVADASSVILVQSGADGMFTVYIDDRAM